MPSASGVETRPYFLLLLRPWKNDPTHKLIESRNTFAQIYWNRSKRKTAIDRPNGPKAVRFGVRSWQWPRGHKIEDGKLSDRLRRCDGTITRRNRPCNQAGCLVGRRFSLTGHRRRPFVDKLPLQ